MPRQVADKMIFVSGLSLVRRIKAFLIHFVVSLFFAGLSALLVFRYWYPGAYREMSGGVDIFTLIVCVDLILGPLITFVIVNAKKTRRHLLLDISFVAALQIFGLSYGLWTAFNARPVYLVFEYHRMAIVHASDIDLDHLEKYRPEYLKLPTSGPELLSLRELSQSEVIESVMHAALGVSQAAQPNLWQPYGQAKTEILLQAKPLTELLARSPGSKQTEEIHKIIKAKGVPVDRAIYLPLLGRKDVWTVIIDSNTAYPVGFVEINTL
jgi:hypothetical protein